MAEVVLRALALKGVAEHRNELVPEFAIHSAEGDILTTGRADAVVFSDAKPSLVFDWKSNVSPTDADRQAYAGQLLKYMTAIGAKRGAVVYLTLRELDWV